jgi:hypothetical protein
MTWSWRRSARVSALRMLSVFAFSAFATLTNTSVCLLEVSLR